MNIDVKSIDYMRSQLFKRIRNDVTNVFSVTLRHASVSSNSRQKKLQILKDEVFGCGQLADMYNYID